MRSRCTLLIASSFIALAGCSIEPGTPGGTGATASATPEQSASESAGASPDPSPSLDAASAEWMDEASATAAMTAFLDQLDSADRYRVERVERTAFVGEYLETIFANVVDVLQERAQSTQTFEVSHPQLWLYLTDGDEEAVERLSWLRPSTVIDFSADRPVMYLTFLGPYGWDGKWLLQDPDEIAAIEGGAALAKQLEHVALDDFTAGLRYVAALDPIEFDAGSARLEYDVPARIAKTWLSGRLRLALQEGGVDIGALRSPVTASISSISGGIEGVLDLTPLMEEAAMTMSDQEVAEQLGLVSATTITVRIYGLGSGLPVRLPTPESIVTEPPPT